MRRTVPLALAAALAVAGCSTPTDPGPNSPDEPPLLACQVSDQNGLDDGGINASTSAGLQAAAGQGQARVVQVESATGADIAPNVESLVAQGCDLIVGTGAATREALQAAAAQHESLRVVLVGGAFTGPDGAPAGIGNGQAVQFSAGQGGYLAGYLAAGASVSGKVAVVGGIPAPATKVVLDGFIDGVAAYNQANAATVAVLGWDKATQQGTFTSNTTDATKGRAAAKGLLDQGADVILGVGGPFQYGVAQAAQDTESARVIWAGSDASELPGVGDRLLASIVENAATPIQEQVAKTSEADFDTTWYLGTLDNAGVELALDSDQSASLGGALRQQLAETTDKLKDGSTKVESASAPAVTS